MYFLLLDLLFLCAFAFYFNILPLRFYVSNP